MPLIDYPDLDEIDEQTREMLEGTRTERGEIPSFTQMLANNPPVFEAALGQFGEVMYGGTLDVDLKQLAFVVVSQENECAYCAATHGDELVNAFGLSETHLEAIAERDYAAFTERQRTVAEFAHKGATNPKRITEDHVEALQAAGFDDADVIELTTVVAQAAFAKTIADAMNIFPSHQSSKLEQYYPKEMPVHE
jgi:uncharacterized peroxidase-related enzyme